MFGREDKRANNRTMLPTLGYESQLKIEPLCVSVVLGSKAKMCQSTFKSLVSSTDFIPSLGWLFFVSVATSIFLLLWRIRSSVKSFRDFSPTEVVVTKDGGVNSVLLAWVFNALVFIADLSTWKCKKWITQQMNLTNTKRKTCYFLSKTAKSGKQSEKKRETHLEIETTAWTGKATYTRTSQFWN